MQRPSANAEATALCGKLGYDHRADNNAIEFARLTDEDCRHRVENAACVYAPTAVTKSRGPFPTPWCRGVRATAAISAQQSFETR